MKIESAENILSMNNSKLNIKLQCPLPKLDFDLITLGHGSGGLLTNQLLDQSVFKILGNDELNNKLDGALLQLHGPIAFSTDSFIVSPIQFPGGDIGDLAINGTVNDLAMCGAKAQYLSLSFILEEGLPVQKFWEILYSIKWACDIAKVKIVTGDTKVVEKGKGDQIFINTSGMGCIHPNAQLNANRIEVGDKVLLSGTMANHGMAILSVRSGLSFESEITSDTRPLHFMVHGLLDEFGEDVKYLTDPTRGGVATVLNELAQGRKWGIDLYQSKLPIEAQVQQGCELLGLDPLYVANEGIFLSVVKASQADRIIAALKKRPEGSQAAIIGEITSEHPQKVILESAIGGKRVVNMLPGEQLPRIC